MEVTSIQKTEYLKDACINIHIFFEMLYISDPNVSDSELIT